MPTPALPLPLQAGHKQGMGPSPEEHRLTLHLVRHGETEASRDHRFCGSDECALTARGRVQSKQVALLCSRLSGWSAVYSSPLRRCLTMAEAAARAVGAPVQVEDGLREIDHGSWDGRLEEDVLREEPEAYLAYEAHPGSNGSPDGENGYGVAARALPVVRRIQEAHPGGRVLIVTHKATLRILVCALLGIDVDRYRDRLSVPEASFTTLELRESGPLLLAYGETSHLREPLPTASSGYTAPGPPDEGER